MAIDDRIELAIEKLLRRGEGRHAPAALEMGAHLRRRLGDADDAERLGQVEEVRQVLDLRDQAAADDADVESLDRRRHGFDLKPAWSAMRARLAKPSLA